MGSSTSAWASTENARRDAPGRRRRRVEVVAEGVPVGRRLRGEPGDLPGTAVVAGVRVDGDDLDAGGRHRGQHDRRATAEAADLDDAPAGAAAGRSVVQAATLVRGHPAVDVGGQLAPGVVTSSFHRTYTARPNTMTHATPSSCSTRSLAKTSSGAAPRPCSRTST